MRRAIKKAVIYADIFDYPLKPAELHAFLERRCSLEELKVELKSLREKGVLEVEKNFYFLPGREDLASLRKEREKISFRKREKVKGVAEGVAKLPWVKMVALTGALAVDNAKEEDDLDLMIVTGGKRLWLTRLFVVLALKTAGIYRTADEVKDKVCTNLWLTTNSLEIEEKNSFTAHEVVQARPLIDKNNWHAEFLRKNKWVFDYFPNHPYKNLLQAPFEKEKKIFLLDVLDFAAFKVQERYMKSKITREVVERERAFFHPRDFQKEVLGKFTQKMEEGIESS